MGLQKSYSLDQLTKLTGYDRRTISYYVQQGVLPRVGRRGPRTRYSQKFLDRLLYIKRVRDLQDTGMMRNVSLAEFRSAFETTPEERISAVASGTEEPSWSEQFRDSGEWEKVAAATQKLSPLKRDTISNEDPVGTLEFTDYSSLKNLLIDLEQRVVARQTGQHNATIERWTQVPITDNIRLAVKSVSDEDLGLVTAVANSIKDLVTD